MTESLGRKVLRKFNRKNKLDQGKRRVKQKTGN